MISVREVSPDEFVALVGEAGAYLPIEQTPQWMEYQQTIPGRSAWGNCVIGRDGEQLGWVAFADFETHGYHYLRSHHGPIWAHPLTAEEEREALRALVSYVHGRDRRVAFMRLAVEHELDITRPTLSITPYDETVIMDITGGEEQILSRMKTRGRRDVRKALRESPATYAEETDLARASFDEYYDVMVETGERDDFTPAPQSDYENMLRILGPERCRVFAGRVDGRVVSWTIVTISGRRAVRYYAASRADVPGRNHITDALLFHEACVLGGEGLLEYDMMGIGSEAYPGLSSLNTFKCKFDKGTVHVAPDRDLPVKQGFYAALQAAKRMRGVLRGEGGK